MSPQPNRNLANWIGKLAADLTPEGSITRLVLWHSVDGDGGDTLCTIEMEGRPQDEDPDDLVMEIWDEAWQDACTRPQGSHQRYVVQAYRGDNSQSEDSKPFTIQGTAVTSLIGNATEPPTPRGLLSQEMRQNDTMHAMMIRMCEATAGSTSVALLKEREENERLRQKGYEFIELREKLLDRQHERDMERDKAKRTDERVDALLTLAQGLLPMVAAKFLGAGKPGNSADETVAVSSPAVLPSSGIAAAAARDKSVGGLLSSLRPEQIENIFATLDPEQSLALMEVYTTHRDEAAPPKSPNTRNGSGTADGPQEN